MSHTVLVEPYPSTCLRLAVLFVGDNGESPVFQPGDDSPQLRSIEHLYRLLYRQPPASQQVGEDFALWVSYHILVVLVCTRIGGQATPGIIVLSISPGGPNRSYHRSFGTCAGRSRISAICLLTAESSKRPHA